MARKYKTTFAESAVQDLEAIRSTVSESPGYSQVVLPGLEEFGIKVIAQPAYEEGGRSSREIQCA